jgi:hypothetical protein
MAEASSPETTRSLPTAEEAGGWVGLRLDEIGGSAVGRIQGVYLDRGSGEPVWVAVKLGHFGRLTAVPATDCAAAAGRVWAAHAHESIHSAPELRHGELTREEELEICAHYGIREGRGRAGQVAAMAEGETTSGLPESAAP